MESTQIANSTTVLDCTLRDGGYYNDWDFDWHVVKRYLSAIHFAGIDVVEIGFRQPATSSFLGPFAFSSDHYLETLELPTNVSIAVMTDARVLLRHDDPVGMVEQLYASASDSPVDIVRIACNLTEVPRIGAGLARLKEKGYKICLNIMQIADKPAKDIATIAVTISDYDCVDVLYFADSLGSMLPEDVRERVSALREGWQGCLGIHTHDNMGNGLANSMAALDAGVGWVDGTILGMGRGAGNVGTEYLLHALREHGTKRYNPDALLPVLMEDFMKLRQQYGWGPNYLYYLAAVHSIHPTYLQRLQESGKVDAESLANALDYLRNSPSHSFNEMTLGQAMNAENVDVAGEWSPAGWATDRDLVLVANGPGAEKHKHAVMNLIRNHKPRVIALNHIRTIDVELIDAFAVCHPSRLAHDLPGYRGLDCPLILPYDQITDRFSSSLTKQPFHNFGIRIEAGKFDVNETACTIPVRKVVPYALAIAGASGARRIFLVGFDGFSMDDPRYNEMNNIFELFRRRFPEIEISAITPSNYNVARSSVYAF